MRLSILDAYEALHDLGIIHGDVRKQNILVLKDESVRIIDFETGRVVEDEKELIDVIEVEEDEVEVLIDTLKPCCGGHT